MGLFDRFRRSRRRSSSGDDPLRRPATARDAEDLQAFLTSREGVEGYLEPETPVYNLSVVLVAADGEHIRRPVKSPKAAHDLLEQHGSPLYDARSVGYPQRMKDFRRGVKPPQISLSDLPPLDVTDEGGEDR